MEDTGATRVLYALKSTGPQSADALARRLQGTGVGGRQRADARARRLKVTVVAARQQLGRLLDKGLVSFEDHREGVGRPKRVWSLGGGGQRGVPGSPAHP